MQERCYLCGETITTDRSVDHVPPKQFFAPLLRSNLNLSQLITLPAHGACNKSFESDEEYFAWSLSPLAMDSAAGEALVRHNTGKFRQGKSQGLGRTTLNEFEPRPSGLHLPRGRVVKRMQGPRIARMAWKLVRGLYFVENASVLDESTPRIFELVEPARAPELAGQNAVWEEVKAQPSKAVYQGVFDYKYFSGDVDGARMHVWGMLLWDRLMLFVAHHHPEFSPIAKLAV